MFARVKSETSSVSSAVRAVLLPGLSCSRTRLRNFGGDPCTAASVVCDRAFVPEAATASNVVNRVNRRGKNMICLRQLVWIESELMNVIGEVYYSNYIWQGNHRLCTSSLVETWPWISLTRCTMQDFPSRSMNCNQRMTFSIGHRAPSCWMPTTPLSWQDDSSSIGLTLAARSLERCG